MNWLIRQLRNFITGSPSSEPDAAGSARDREISGDVGATDSGDRYEAYRRASGVVGRAQLLGIVALFLFAVQAGTFVTFFSVFGVGLMIGVSAFAVGGLVGFVFGIPRSLQEPSATPSTPAPDPAEPGAELASQRARYAGNTSLEQISDWLTKILVGVGLTQLANIPSALSSLGETFAPALGGFAASPVVGPLEVVFFGTGGFFLGYLWTRLRLGPLLAASDDEMKAAQQRLERRAAAAVTDLRKVPEPAPASAATARRTSSYRLATCCGSTINQGAIRGDRPIAAAGHPVTTKTSTEEALAELTTHPERYGVVITDMARGLDRRAAYTLLKELRDRDIQIPVVIYAGAGAGSAERNAEARDRGAIGSTDSPIRLFEMVARALQTQAAKGTDSEPST